MQNVTIQFLTNLVEHHQALAYTVIFLGLVIEGEFFLIFTGIMAHLGAINLWVAFLFALAGVFGKTFFGYALGKYLFKNEELKGKILGIIGMVLAVPVATGAAIFINDYADKEK